MFIFEIVTPGTWLEGSDPDWIWKVEGQLTRLKSTFFEANVALNLFAEGMQQAQHEDGALADRRAEFRLRQQRFIAIRAEVERDWKIEPTDRSRERLQALDLEVEIRYKREQWAGGDIPGVFKHRRPFIFARSFLYALDQFDKYLIVLSKMNGVPPGVVDLPARMRACFPNLHEVRNTVQHMDERTQGLATRNRPIPYKPISSGIVEAPNGAPVFDSLAGSKYGTVMADGHYGEVDVSPESMQLLSDILVSTLTAFSWTGPPMHSPS